MQREGTSHAPAVQAVHPAWEEAEQGLANECLEAGWAHRSAAEAQGGHAQTADAEPAGKACSHYRAVARSYTPVDVMQEGAAGTSAECLQMVVKLKPCCG